MPAAGRVWDVARVAQRKRKRRPRQYWVAKGDGGSNERNDTFVRDTRQKTSTVFDRIEEPTDSSADPEGQGRRAQ